MRLVDADKLLYMGHEEAMEHIEHGCDYDPEKVIDELEELPTHTVTITSDKHPFSVSEIETVSREQAVKIIRKGGAELW